MVRRPYRQPVRLAGTTILPQITRPGAVIWRTLAAIARPAETSCRSTLSLGRSRTTYRIGAYRLPLPPRSCPWTIFSRVGSSIGRMQKESGDVTRLFSQQVSTAVHEGGQAASAANYYLYPPDLKDD